MNEKKESQFFRPNIHKFFATFLKKTHLQDADYGHHSTDQKWIYNFLYLFKMSDQGCNRKLARPAYGLT